MQPYLCSTIQKAWEVKRSLDARGFHVRIEIVYPFGDYPKRDPKKRSFLCWPLDIPRAVPEQNPQSDTVLSFISRMVEFQNRNQADNPKPEN